jgi:dephospho-CoA kinase
MEATARWLADMAADDSVDVAAVEAVKLIESGMHRQFDSVWLIVCDRAERRQRLAERGWSPEEATRRIAASSPLEAQIEVADVTIDNSGSPDATLRQLEVAWRDVLRSAARP